MSEHNFIKAVEELGINLTDLQLNQLEKFYNLLIEWNQRMNLTRITEKEDVYLKHFYDSLTIAKVIDLESQETLCDIGTGAGFPGIVLKIVFPNLKITLVDSLQKRVNYLNEIIKELQLKDIFAVHERAEIYVRNNEEKYDIVTARAVANLSTLLDYTISAVKTTGYFIAMKGHVEEELEGFSEKEKQYKCVLETKNEFLLPYENSVRTLLKIKKLEKTPIINKRIARNKKKML